MRYDDWTFLYPPRPERAIIPSMISTYESMGWIAQAKMNGTCNVMGVSPDNQIKAMSRHGTDHKLWSPTEETIKPFLNLPRANGGWYVFVTELLHSKVSGIRNYNYIHDIIVADGTQLVGTSFKDRQAILRELFIPKARGMECSVIDDHTLLAENHTTNLKRLFDALRDGPANEGLVLKNPNAELSPCFKASANSGWQVKSRYPHKNYSF